jgi:hypothetical protein
MATDIDVTYQWWLPALLEEGQAGMYHYSTPFTDLVAAEAMWTSPATMLPDDSKLFKIEYVPVTAGGVLCTRRDVTELAPPAR